MSRWPDFFIVGAARCGTTSLYYYLKGHPDIFMPSTKEPHFFTDLDEDYSIRAERGFALPVGLVRGERDYLRLFRGAKPGQVAGEASTSYLAHYPTPALIWEKNPQAKIIAILREPIDRAYSAYLMALRELRDGKSTFYEALQEDYDYMTKFSNAWGVYIWRGLYYEQVKRYMDTFGRENVRVYLYEDLAADTTALVEDVCSFLGVPFYDGGFFDPDRKYHTYGALRNGLVKWVGRSRAIRSVAAAIAPIHLLVPLRDRLVARQQSKPQLDPRAREFLSSIYRDDIMKLQNLISRDLSGWLA